jgi:tRNA(Ile)-lysidine synthase TilS/MesJ
MGIDMSEPEYEITKEDIVAMLHYLRLTAPEHATPEKAIYLLDHYNIHLKKLEDLYPEVIEDILKDFEEH